MDSSALQPGATVVAAVIVVSAPLVFASLGNRSGRRRTAELELLTKLADLRPGLGDELSRAKIDTLTADYLDDVQIGLRDEARASTRLMLVMLLAWAAGLALQIASSLVTDPDLSGVLRQVLWGAYAVQLLATVAIVMATAHAWRTFRGWRRIGRQAERRAKILELKAGTRLARIRDLNQELRDERRALTADIEHAGKLLEQVEHQTNTLGALKQEVDQEVDHNTKTARDLVQKSRDMLAEANRQTEYLAQRAADAEGSEDDAPM